MSGQQQTINRAGRFSGIRPAGIAAILAGLAIAISPFALSLFGNANGGQRILDRFRTTLSVQGLAALKGSYTTVESMSDEFLQRTLPDLRVRLRESPATFQADLRSHYPAIASAQRNVPPVFALVDPKVPQLLALHDEFAKVDSLPFLGLPLSSVPWLLFGVGLGVTALGLTAVVRPRVSGGAAIAIVGLGVVAVPLALSIPSKADAGVKLQAAGKFVFSPQIAPAALATTQAVSSLVDEIQTAFLPQTAARLHESTARLAAQIGSGEPAVTRGLAAWPAIRPTAFRRAQDQVASVQDAVNIDGIDVRAVAWWVIGPGALMLLAGLLAFALPSSSRLRADALPEPSGQLPHLHA